MTTYCVVNVPFAGQSIEIPYICAQILLDGANLSFMGLIQEIPTDEIRMGMRVEAVWVDETELTPSLASVKYFRPNGEPDADYETLQGVPVSAAGRTVRPVSIASFAQSQNVRRDDERNEVEMPDAGHRRGLRQHRASPRTTSTSSARDRPTTSSAARSAS